jgi:hypothetical protein
MDLTFRALLLITVLTYPSVDDDKTEPFVVTIPGGGWQINLNAPPLEEFAGQTTGKNFAFQAAGKGGFNVSAYVETPQSDRQGHEACYEHYWPLAKRNPLIDQASVKVVKSKNFVKVAYIINPPGNANGKENRHVNYYFAYQGRWVDVHASQSPPRDDEGKLFDAFERGLSYAQTKAQPGAR